MNFCKLPSRLIMSESRSAIVNSCKRDAVDIYRYALDSIRPDKLVERSVLIDQNKLVVKQNNICSDSGIQNDLEINLNQANLHVVGAGKSVLGMALGLAKIARRANVCHLFSHGSLSLPISTPPNLGDEQTPILDSLKSINTNCNFGSRDNQPDDDSVAATQDILDNIEFACDKALKEGRRPVFIVLISGGGSACLTSPLHVNLREKLELIKFLVQNGADIVELNKVRRCLSNVKGGCLAAHILRCHPKSQVLTLLLSDVVGNPVEFIASGPTSLSSLDQNSKFEQMVGVLKKYGYSGADELVKRCKLAAETDLKGFTEREVFHRIIGSNSIAIDAAVQKALSLNYSVIHKGNDLQGQSDEVVEEVCKIDLPRDANFKVISIGGGEATIIKRPDESWGKGGRAQEMALDYLIMRKTTNILPDDSQLVDVFMAGGTDGQDGPTDVAACLASQVESKDDFDMNILREAKRCHDSYNFWSERKPDCLIKTGLSGTNVMDLFMLLLVKAG